MTKAKDLKRHDFFRIEVPVDLISVTPLDWRPARGLVRVGLVDTKSLEFTDQGMQLEFICPQGREFQVWWRDDGDDDAEEEPVPPPSGGDLELV